LDKPKRSSLEMDIAVLQALSASSHPLIMTHIMYRANVNCGILKGKLVALEAKGLISSHKVFCSHGHISKSNYEHPVFGLTAKGLDVLRSYLSVYEALGRVELEQ
jgi:predicted transcriptional regulator